LEFMHTEGRKLTIKSLDIVWWILWSLSLFV
jgi:hypothetical protein